jgi:uncharacterized protein YndB with AHSA1/START domain
MNEPTNERTYVYAIHIATTPERLWEALTSNEFIQQYWPEWRIESEWRVGSPVTYRTADGTFYSQGEVLECSPPNRLSYTWPESEGEKQAALPEQLVWEITAKGPETVKLLLVHSRLSEEFYKGVGEGWPMILSSLKSLLEVGKPLAFQVKEPAGAGDAQSQTV